MIGTYGLSGLVVLLGGAIWLEYYKKWLPLLVIVGVSTLLWLLPSSAVPPDPLAVVNVRVIQPNIGQEDKWRPGFDEEAARRLAMLSGPPTNEPRLLSGPKLRSSIRWWTRAPISRARPNSSALAQLRCSAPMTG